LRSSLWIGHSYASRPKAIIAVAKARSIQVLKYKQYFFLQEAQLVEVCISELGCFALCSSGKGIVTSAQGESTGGGATGSNSRRW
jgi:hypothetical protein